MNGQGLKITNKMEELPNEEETVSPSFLLFFESFYRSFRLIMGMTVDEGGNAPFRTIDSKERAKLWCSLNGFKWSITIEREKV